MADSCFDKRRFSIDKTAFCQNKTAIYFAKRAFREPQSQRFCYLCKKGRATYGKGLCLYEVCLCCCGVMFFEKQR